MRTIRKITELRGALAESRRIGHTVGLVPTMGAFHDGHLSLMDQAREACDVVVVSLFVNPTQFNDPGDLATYPRDAERDTRLAELAGVDYLFSPEAAELYPPGFATTVSVAGLTESLEGAHRGRKHFEGVATVVTKLLNIVMPDIAYFGQKDAQQALVIRRLVRDLDMPVAIEICPTIRDPDGLALSSRNRRLSDDERERAVTLSRALAAVRQAVADGETDPALARAKGLAELRPAGIEPEYFELVAPETLEPVPTLGDGSVLAVLAATVGSVRLIDNEIIEPLSTAAGGGGANEPLSTAAAVGGANEPLSTASAVAAGSNENGRP